MERAAAFDWDLGRAGGSSCWTRTWGGQPRGPACNSGLAGRGNAPGGPRRGGAGETRPDGHHLGAESRDRSAGRHGRLRASASGRRRCWRRPPAGFPASSCGSGSGVPGRSLDLDASFLEARRALAIGRWRSGPEALTVFDDLGLDRLLAAVPEGELAAFRGSVLGPLEAYDAERGTDLVGTLDTFLATRNAAATARRLYLHYNTVKNRLSRIEELLGPYLEDADRTLALALALRLRRRPTD